MRREPFTIGSYVHVIKRGVRGTSIVRDDLDRWRFVLMLLHFNDDRWHENWFRDLMDENMAHTLERPRIWKPRVPIVKIICYCLLDNHFHLLLKEITKGGITKFMHRLGTGMANHFNEKYHERGSLFQGPFRSRTVGDDVYFRYVSAYIQVKNAFECYPGGIKKATLNFSQAYQWATKYPYCSLGHYAGVRQDPILDFDLLNEIYPKPNDYKVFAKDFIYGRNAGLGLGEENLNLLHLE